ncbi:hypothetical protein BU15DRAFT_66766 [Melanogaster broomeanus]|nr:hypothetical protein BU15DRAFT_66766 [Melanogaster broomeanus]
MGCVAKEDKAKQAITAQREAVEEEHVEEREIEAMNSSPNAPSSSSQDQVLEFLKSQQSVNAELRAMITNQNAINKALQSDVADQRVIVTKQNVEIMALQASVCDQKAINKALRANISEQQATNMELRDKVALLGVTLDQREMNIAHLDGMLARVTAELVDMRDSLILVRLILLPQLPALLTRSALWLSATTILIHLRRLLDLGELQEVYGKVFCHRFQSRPWLGTLRGERFTLEDTARENMMHTKILNERFGWRRRRAFFKWQARKMQGGLACLHLACLIDGFGHQTMTFLLWTFIARSQCILKLPSNPLTAQGLATPYELTGCDGAFVEAAILDPATGSIQIHHPLVINAGMVVVEQGQTIPPQPRRRPVALTLRHIIHLLHHRPLLMTLLRLSLRALIHRRNPRQHPALAFWFLQSYGVGDSAFGQCCNKFLADSHLAVYAWALEQHVCHDNANPDERSCNHQREPLRSSPGNHGTCRRDCHHYKPNTVYPLPDETLSPRNPYTLLLWGRRSHPLATYDWMRKSRLSSASYVFTVKGWIHPSFVYYLPSVHRPEQSKINQPGYSGKLRRVGALSFVRFTGKPTKSNSSDFAMGHGGASPEEICHPPENVTRGRSCFRQIRKVVETPKIFESKRDNKATTLSSETFTLTLDVLSPAGRHGVCGAREGADGVKGPTGGHDRPIKREAHRELSCGDFTADVCTSLETLHVAFDGTIAPPPHVASSAAAEGEGQVDGEDERHR